MRQNFCIPFPGIQVRFFTHKDSELRTQNYLQVEVFAVPMTCILSAMSESRRYFPYGIRPMEKAWHPRGSMDPEYDFGHPVRHRRHPDIEWHI